MTRCIALRNTTAATVITANLDCRVNAYGAPPYTLTDSGKQLVAKFFDLVCRMFGSKRYLRTTYHPQTNGKTERFNKTAVGRVRRYVADNQTEWDQYLQLPAHSYSKQARGAERTTPFDRGLTRHPPSIALLGAVDRPGTPASDERLTLGQYKQAVIHRLRYAMKKAGNKRTAVRRRYKKVLITRSDFG